MNERSDRRARAAVHVPFGVVAFVVLVALLRVAMQHWREGATLLGGALVLAAVLRAVFSPDQVGLLGIRSRAVDILLYSGLGTLVLFLAFTIEGGPLDFD
ncbi:DUF3017 domain-containing protein [Allosaccharopolyspora coralli]|uniref:DUF3017 domain-containing protein n=1 Tax=Allosaccharopolyspora coralli TaxID=2665642 RepID=A0A5Q3QAA9_9PSEU|nr:DUF3017 domain-containing protein [Allosaccharopolyspora coralli]QGK71422.1 DUF3017 domain-containing protein [Allosaccharopolyspora coralli]